MGTTGTVTSCKDYDDDINANTQAINDVKSALESCKTSCEASIGDLKKQLEAKSGEIATLTSQLATVKATADAAATKAALQDEINRALAAEGALAAKITSLEGTVKDIKNVLDGKVDKSVYDAAIADIYAKLTANEQASADNLLKIGKLQTTLSSLATTVDALKADYDQQLAALGMYNRGVESRLVALENAGISAADLAKIQEKIDAAKAEIQGQIDALAIKDIEGLQAALDGKASVGDLNTLKEQVAKNVKAIDALSTQVNVLNVLVQKSLRSLVFVPDAYYYGIEATKIQALDFFKFKVPATAWNIKEAKGYKDDLRYDYTAASRVLTFVANYHMNPSSAELKDGQNKVTILTDDKEYINTRAAASAPFTVKSFTTNNGDLAVNIDVADVNKIKTVADNQMVTVFATQVNVNKSGADTTVTSDYAALVKETVKNLKLVHAAGSDVPWVSSIESPHKSVLQGQDATHKHHQILMQTVNEAANKNNAPQDTVNYNETLDLTKLVEVHYTTASGETRLLTAEQMAANGLKYKFDLTALYFGSNETSESAHAAINPKDGVTFRPQMPEYDAEHVGKQQAYGAAQDRQAIGRTPVVRVELVDEAGNVLDYGYIRIRISEKAAIPVADKSIAYTGNDFAYNGDCKVKWSYKTKWIQTEYDLYNMLGLTREEFESIYTAVKDEESDLKQYTKDANGKFSAAATKYGIVYEHNDISTEDGTLTQVLEWKLDMTGDEAEALIKAMQAAKKTAITTAVKYESNNSRYPDVYVEFSTGKLSISAPSASVEWAANQISNYWYTSNTNNAGTAEIHTNTLTPEDNANGTAKDLDNTFTDVFTGNKITTSAFVKNIIDKTSDKDYAASKLTLNLVFDKSNNGKEYKGYLNGVEKTFVMKVSADGKTLYAYDKADNNKTEQEVAVLVGDDVNSTKVKYVANDNKNGYSEAMLNYRAHNALADNVIKAIIGLQAQNDCGKALALTNNTFDVRFLRPINVFNADKEITDAATTELQTINVNDLVKFTDWRDVWNKKSEAGNGGAYFTYYGIESITVPGVKDDQNISLNSLVVTNLGQADANKFVPLSSVSNQVDFIYSAGTITYKNLSSTLRDFDVKIPVAVKYIWGTIYSNVTIHVHKTAGNGNAKRL